MHRPSGIARMRRPARRRAAGGPASDAVGAALDVPLGAKLELTHRCNLRCAFCYTDSPRRTLERPRELTDDDWASVVDQVVELGVLEAVVTGGEPLLRRELALVTLERLGAAGVSTMFNTNGWHVDEAAADRLAGVPGLRVHISLDGACAATHDASRGVAGSWRRAITAIDLLTSRAVEVIAVHVLLPGREHEVPTLLRQAWALGVARVRLSPIVGQGAARGGAWRSDTSRLRDAMADSALRPMRVELLSDPLGEHDAPRAAFLVRPNGDVVPDSRRPFVFGHAIEDTLAASWQRLVEAGGSAPPRPGHNPYGDPDVRLDGRAPEQRPAGDAALAISRQLLRAREKAPAGVPDLAGADALVERLALRRRHRLDAVRRSRPSAGGEYVRVLASQQMHRLNATASAILDGGATRSLREIADELSARHPDVARTRIRRDVVGAARDLQARGVIAPLPSSCA